MFTCFIIVRGVQCVPALHCTDYNIPEECSACVPCKRPVCCAAAAVGGNLAGLEYSL